MIKIKGYYLIVEKIGAFYKDCDSITIIIDSNVLVIECKDEKEADQYIKLIIETLKMRGRE